MARADRRQAARQARRVERRPRAVAGGARMVEDTMFFPKLRAHVKWMFVLLAFVFAAGFVFLGVGSGSSGIGDLLQGNIGSLFGGGSGASNQIKKDQARIAKNAKDFGAYRDLASAQAAKGKLDDAIATLQQLKALHPNDVAGLTQLASLELRKADIARNAAANAQAAVQSVPSASTFAPGGTSPLAKAYQSFSGPVSSLIQKQATDTFQTAYSNMTSAYTAAVTDYKAIAKLTPSDPSVEITLGQAAELAQDTTTAIAAYKRFLKLAPQDPTAPAVRTRIHQLEQQAHPTVTTGSSTKTVTTKKKKK